MNADQILTEIREANLSYLMLAQSLIRQDRASALLQLGLNEEVAQIVEMLTPAQIIRLALSRRPDKRWPHAATLPAALRGLPCAAGYKRNNAEERPYD